jgi:hypothetical protein
MADDYTFEATLEVQIRREVKAENLSEAVDKLAEQVGQEMLVIWGGDATIVEGKVRLVT